MLSNIRVKFKKSLIETYDNLIDHLILHPLQCPNCKAKGLMKIHGYYHRHVIAFLNNQLTQERLKIMRLKCESCGSTHAVLPEFIIPYCTYSYDVILDCLKRYFDKQKIHDLCERYNVSFQLIYSWIKRLDAHKNQCILMFRQGPLILKAILNKIYEYSDISTFLIDYFHENRHCFMQIIKSP